MYINIKIHKTITLAASIICKRRYTKRTLNYSLQRLGNSFVFLYPWINFFPVLSFYKRLDNRFLLSTFSCMMATERIESQMLCTKEQFQRRDFLLGWNAKVQEIYFHYRQISLNSTNLNYCVTVNVNQAYYTLNLLMDTRRY